MSDSILLYFASVIFHMQNSLLLISLVQRYPFIPLINSYTLNSYISFHRGVIIRPQKFALTQPEVQENQHLFNHLSVSGFFLFSFVFVFFFFKDRMLSVLLLVTSEI